MKMNERKISETTIRDVVTQLTSGKLPLNQMTMSDSEQPGLRILVRSSGGVTFHVQYSVAGTDKRRPYIKIGDFETMRLSTARELTKTIRGLADNGIDPFDRLQEQRVDELIKHGTKWRPGRV